MYSLIIPVYRNEECLPALLEALEGINSQLGGSLEAVFVVDGSPDASADLLASRLPQQRYVSQLILLSRNFGAFAAMRIGMAHASGPEFAVMAADLQEPPELAVQFFRILAAEPVDVVVGTRQSRSDPIGRRLSAALFWSIYRRLVVHEMPVGGVDVFGCNREFRDHLLSCDETNTSLVALLYWLGFRRREVGYARRERTAGKSSWSLRKRWNYMLDSVFAFTDLPVKLLLAIGGLGVSVAFVFGAVVFAARLAGLVLMPGYAATVLSVLLFGGLNTLGLGLVGSYAWRAYENTKRRPAAIAMRVMQFAAAVPIACERDG